MNKKDYSNLSKTFEDESEDIEKKFQLANKEISKNKNFNLEESKKVKKVRVSISMEKEDVEFILKIKGLITNPKENFYPSISDIYRIAIEKLKKTEKEFFSNKKTKIEDYFKN